MFREERKLFRLWLTETVTLVSPLPVLDLAFPTTVTSIVAKGATVEALPTRCCLVFTFPAIGTVRAIEAGAVASFRIPSDFFGQLDCTGDAFQLFFQRQEFIVAHPFSTLLDFCSDSSGTGFKIVCALID